MDIASLHILSMVSRTPLVWTDAKPTVPGWYWHRYGPRDGDAPTVHELAFNESTGELGVDRGIEWCELFDGQFAGPIPQPEEPR